MSDEARMINVKVRNIYGRDVYYPDCKVSRFFASLCGTKTLTDAALKKIKEQGFIIKETKEIL